MGIGGPFGGTVAVAVAVKAGPAVCQAGGCSGLEGMAPGVAAGRDEHGGMDRGDGYGRGQAEWRPADGQAGGFGGLEGIAPGGRWGR